MGILNITPDSFSDGGDYSDLPAALARAETMVGEGVDLLDIGGESTRPGADAVEPQEEMDRVLPVIEAVASAFPVPVSVDTRRASVAREGVAAGARVVNDVSGFKHDPDMAGVVAEARAGAVLSHMRGTPATMKAAAHYSDVVAEVAEELRESVSIAEGAGVEPGRIVLDPGIGFAKTGAQSLTLLGSLPSLVALGRPVLIGPSRKSFIGEITGVPARERGPGTLAACIVAYLGGARIFRVHEVGPLVQALKVTRAILDQRAGERVG
jgi:dihydropteroate synthase